jgi:UPF0755 protein
MRLAARLGAVVAGLVVIGVGAAWLDRATLGPFPLAGEVVVEIPRGATARDVARLLEKHGVIRAAPAFRLLALLSGRSRDLKAGEYRFDGTVTPGEALARIARGDTLLHEVVLREGMTRAATLAALRSSALEIEGDLEAAARQVSLIADLDGQATDLEGYLFPDTYHFPRRVEALVVVRAMVDRFRAVAASLQEEIGPAGHGVRPWVTLASLVESETGREEERARIAGVFAHRLRRGMPLQCDPTVAYALAASGKPAPERLAPWLDFDHPYNTYRRRGLPPGPIVNPGEASLRAALRPPVTDELYFVADGQGGHVVSRTLAQHNLAIQRQRASSPGGAR